MKDLKINLKTGNLILIVIFENFWTDKVMHDK